MRAIDKTRASGGPSGGYSLVEILVTLTLVSVAATVVVPKIRTLAGDAHLRAASQAVAAILHATRSEAARTGGYVGLRFERREGGHWVGVAYRDGDGDGIRSDDISNRVDPELWRRNVEGMDQVVRFGIIAEMAPRDPSDPGQRLTRLDDPIRFGNPNIASFGPLGTSSPGSVYLRDGNRRQTVVRLYGRTGKLRVLTYDPAEQAWR